MISAVLQKWKSFEGGCPQPSLVRSMLGSLTQRTAEDQCAIVREFDDWTAIVGLWFVMAPYRAQLEALARDPAFPARGRAALLCSKIQYCCEEYKGALEWALEAGNDFNLIPATVTLPPKAQIDNFLPHDEFYVNKIILEALDSYKSMGEEARAGTNLEAFINRIFSHNLDRGDLSVVVGLGLDLGRLDMVEAAVRQAPPEAVTSLLTETIQRAVETQLSVGFREQVLSTVFALFRDQPSPDFVAMCECLIKLEKPKDVASILHQLAKNEDDLLLAYQLSFDLYENAPQEFIGQLEQALFPAIPMPMQEGADEGDETAMDTGAPEEEDQREDSEEIRVEVLGSSSPSTEEKTQGVSEEGEPVTGGLVDDLAPEVSERLRRILSGEETIKQHLQFLIKNNATDMLILRQVKDSVRTSTAQNATVIASGLMHVGTTTDDFLRDNLEWVSKAVNWNKFNAVASLGLIHMGHETNAERILEPYLPKGEMDQYGYKEGGALYAYGLIHANHGSDSVIGYLVKQLASATTSAVRHGASLGLGLAALGTRNRDVFEGLKQALYLDDAVTGEAAGTAMGLVMAGSMNEEAFSEMKQYVCETQHDKIQRGLRMGIAALGYGRLEHARPYIDSLLREHSNAVLRQTGVLMIALAYVGSGNAQVLHELLERVANDPNNDVKRFAVIAIGFVLCNDPEQCLNYVGTLIEQWNPHVRYGAAIALAIAYAGTGSQDAIKILEPMTQAKENFVRQGTLIAMSFVLVQQTAPSSPGVADFRKSLMKIATDKAEDSIVKFGAIIAYGLLDAGGRNVTISMHNRNGQPNMPAVLGTFVFLHHWYFYSMTHFVSLAFRPTCLIGLNKNLQMPKIEFRCNAKPSLFAYPPPLEETKKDDTGKVETAVLSITKKKQTATVAPTTAKKDSSSGVTEKAATGTTSSAAASGGAASEAEKMEVDEPKVPAQSTGDAEEKGKEAEKDQAKETPAKPEQEETKDKDKPAPTAEPKTKESGKEKEAPEPNFFAAKNPARAIRQQLGLLAMPEGCRYQPMKPLSYGGIIVLRDKKPEEAEEIVEQAVAGGMLAPSTSAAVSTEEPKSHTPFEFGFNDY